MLWKNSDRFKYSKKLLVFKKNNHTKSPIQFVNYILKFLLFSTKDTHKNNIAIPRQKLVPRV